ncbi:MAG TPA: hypothetical protein VJS11_12445, partial [Acidobacteriaceae bacterium]|nr:hypothetical protein [Acidobacteriaceae bacterium]
GCWELRPPETGGNTFFEGEEEPCINGGALALAAYFGRPADTLLRRLLAEQLDDGGWNCEAPRSKRSSFHTTICVLEGLLEYQRAAGPSPQLAAVISRAQQYFVDRALYRRLSTGEVIDPTFLQFAFPPRYRYDVLRALDCLRDSAFQPDARLAGALHLVESKRQPDGRWLLDASYDETPHGIFNESPGSPSRWNTLRALRVLRWFGQSALHTQT